MLLAAKTILLYKKLKSSISIFLLFENYFKREETVKQHYSTNYRKNTKTKSCWCKTKSTKERWVVNCNTTTCKSANVFLTSLRLVLGKLKEQNGSQMLILLLTERTKTEGIKFFLKTIK